MAKQRQDNRAEGHEDDDGARRRWQSSAYDRVGRKMTEPGDAMTE